jgi:hypothetical protein
VDGNAQTAPLSLPDKWSGKWQPFVEDITQQGNAQLTEQWGVIQESEMILSPHSIAFWFDLFHDPIEFEPGLFTDPGVLHRDGYVEQQIKNSSYTGIGWDTAAYHRQELMVEQVYNRQSAFSILEISNGTNGSYDVLASQTKMVRDDDKPGVFNTEINYFKFNMRDGTAGYTNEVWITFYYGDSEWDTSSDDITVIKSASNLDINRDRWGFFEDGSTYDPIDDPDDPDYDATQLLPPHMTMFVVKR